MFSLRGWLARRFFPAHLSCADAKVSLLPKAVNAMRQRRQRVAALQQISQALRDTPHLT
jgi:hypothetical protein